MTTNGDIPSSDAEMAECDGEEVVTMMDVLKEQQEFEDDANAVLGGSDEKECTYSQGYIKRQAIYACMTCCPESKDDPSKRAGFCLACSLSCHENHDLVELYTKRNFRCDCGNPKFKSSCQFTPNKPELNNENDYNQNFIGLYCSCSKPYGDPETTLDDEMIQCIICEDWWHATHLDAIVPPHDQYSEMICKLCMAKNEFLHDYSNYTVNVEYVDVVKVNGLESTETTKLTNGSVTAENLNGIDEKLTENSEEKTENNSIIVPNESTNENTASDDDKSLKTDVAEYEADLKETEENKSDLPMETEDTEKPTEVLPEISTEDKPETTSADLESSSAPSESEIIEITKDPVEIHKENEPSEKIEKSSSTDNMEDVSQSIAKTDADNAESETTETTSESSKEIKESAQSETETEKDTDTEIFESIENNKTDDNKNLETGSTNVVTDEASAADHENDKTNEVQVTPTSQEEEMNGVHKDIEIQAKDNIDDTSKQVVVANENESTNVIDTKNVVPELASTEKKRKIDDTDNNSHKKPKLDDSKCIRPKEVKKTHKGATFWPSTFRQKLCTCNECIEMYKDLNVLFLTDMEDTVFAYETLGKEKTAGKLNQYEKGMEALSSLGRIQQIDALTEYNKMRDKLLNFLQNFKEKQEVVTEHDIKTFFAGMKPEKRTDGVYFCR